MSALVATTMLTGTAHAADKCMTVGDIAKMPYENIFNKTELTAKDKCWLDVHKADESHGIDGSVFWVKVGGKYYSTHISQLREKSDRTAWLDSVKADFTGSYEAVQESSNDLVIATAEVKMAESTEELEKAIEDRLEAEAALAKAMTDFLSFFCT